MKTYFNAINNVYGHCHPPEPPAGMQAFKLMTKQSIGAHKTQTSKGMSDNSKWAMLPHLDFLIWDTHSLLVMNRQKRLAVKFT